MNRRTFLKLVGVAVLAPVLPVSKPMVAGEKSYAGFNPQQEYFNCIKVVPPRGFSIRPDYSKGHRGGKKATC